MKRRYLCDVPGCTHERKKWERLCISCWKALPWKLRDRIITSFRHGLRKQHREACRDARATLDAAAAHRPETPAWDAPHMMRD